MTMATPKAMGQEATEWSWPPMAAHLAADIPAGWCVNLGIGIPTMVPDPMPLEREVIVQSGNGELGKGRAPAVGGTMDLAPGITREGIVAKTGPPLRFP